MNSAIIFLYRASVSGRIFGLDQQTFISVTIQLFNATVLAAVMAFILYKPVSKFLQKRRETIKKQLDDAEVAQKEAEELRILYQEKLEKAEEEKKRILKEAREAASLKSEQIIMEAENQAQVMIKEALATIQQEKERSGEELRQQIIEIATLMAEKIVTLAIDEKTQNDLYEEALKELENLL